MSSMQRNDITVAVDSNGRMWIAQGCSAAEKLPDDLDDIEYGLYYSQLIHRCAWHDGERYRVGTPTEAKQTGVTEPSRFGRFTAKATGNPILWGPA